MNKTQNTTVVTTIELEPQEVTSAVAFAAPHGIFSTESALEYAVRNGLFGPVCAAPLTDDVTVETDPTDGTAVIFVVHRFASTSESS